jgi:hypothetical protein
MDAFFLTKALDKETYDNMPTKPKMSLFEVLQFALSLTISIFAAYLAWNAGKSDTMFFRIFTSVLAFLFSTLYILGYVIYKFVS